MTIDTLSRGVSGASRPGPSRRSLLTSTASVMALAPAAAALAQNPPAGAPAQRIDPRTTLLDV